MSSSIYNVRIMNKRSGTLLSWVDNNGALAEGPEIIPTIKDARKIRERLRANWPETRIEILRRTTTIVV